MQTSRVKAKLKRNEPVLLTTLHLADPSLYEMTSLLGFDGIWMDLEHHAYSVETASGLMRAARVGGADIMARCAKGEFMRMGRLLESGAQGIMYPRCDDAHEAREIVRWSKFAPLGQRGYDSANPDMPYCFMPMEQYIKEANEQTFLVVQIEDPNALANAEAIAQVDVLFLGPADFSILSGVPGQFDHPKVLDAMKTIARAAKSAGKHWGTLGLSVERTQIIMELGGRFICYGCDLIWVKQCLEETQGRFGPLGFTFDRRV
jgi:4-hydroxy-2-oxoheptanedioate aldolase